MASEYTIVLKEKGMDDIVLIETDNKYKINDIVNHIDKTKKDDINYRTEP